MSSETDNEPRSGSGQDLAKRMDRMETSHAGLAAQVSGLTGTVARVELNQQHAEELNRLRFTSLEQAVGGVAGKLDAFMGRIESIFTGEVKLPMQQQGEELVADYKIWRGRVDDRLDAQDVLNGQVRLLGRLAILLVTSNVIAVAAAALAVIHP
jgi:hypothetical protein